MDDGSIPIGQMDDERAVDLFIELFPPNPTRHGILRALDPATGRKTVATIAKPVTKKMIRGHLHLPGQEGRLGYNPVTEEGTKVGSIDVDRRAYGTQFELVVGDQKQALSLAAIPWYEEVSTNGGSHIDVFSDELVSHEDMHHFLRAMTEEAGHPELETFPSSAHAGVDGRWILMPYSGALVDESRLGTTFLRDRNGEPIAIDLLNYVQRVEASVIRRYAERYREQLQERQQAGEDEAAAVQDLDPEEAWKELSRAVMAPPKKKGWARHDAIISFINLASRAQRVGDMVELLKTEEVWRLWTGEDGSRTYEVWTEEVDRWHQRWVEDADKLRPRHGIPHLLDSGWELGSLKRAGNALLVTSGSLEKLPEAELAEAASELLVSRGHIWAYDSARAEAYKYDGQTYVARMGHVEAIKRDLETILWENRKTLRESKLTNVYRKLERIHLARSLMEEAHPDIIAVENGLLNWKTLELMPHDPGIVTIGKLKAAWDPDIEVDGGAWDRFLHWAVRDQEDGDRYADLLREFFGYCLVRATPVRAFMDLHGPSSTGKTTAWKTITGVIGETNAGDSGLAYVTDQGLFDAQDWARHLMSPSVVVIDELNTSDPQSGRRLITNLKMIAGGATLTVNPKGRDSTSATTRAKVVVCTNFDFRLREDASNDSLFRRMVRVKFPNVVARGSEASAVHERILAVPGERERILRWLVDGLRSLWKRNWSLSHSDLREAAVSESRLRANTVAAFLNDCCVVEEGAYTGSKELWQHFRAWAVENNHKRAFQELSLIGFGMKMEDAVAVLGWSREVYKRKTDGGKMGWRHLRYVGPQD